MGNFWEDFKDSATKLAKTAITRTTAAVDITKLNLAKSDTEGKINKLYQKIGESVYAQYKDGAIFDGDIPEVAVEIDKFKAELDEIIEQLAALKNTVTCPSCGYQNPKDSAFCAKCGGKMCPEEEAGYDENATVDVVSEDE